MSAYPPPPPPPPFPPSPSGGFPGQYPPVYDRRAQKAQRRQMEMAARLQRDQMRMQRRALRRGSVVGPLVLLALGVLFLLAQTGKLPWSHVVGWYAHWWPLILIGAGVVLLAEWAFDQRAADDGTVRPARTLGGGVVFLLIVLALAGGAANVAEHVHRAHDVWGRNFAGWDHMVGNRHDADDSLSSPVAAGSAVAVRNGRGDVTVVGSSQDGQVHVAVHKQAWSWQDNEAEDKERRLQPSFTTEGTMLVLTVPTVEGGQADVTVEVPRESAVTVQADRGDVKVSEMHAPVTLSANHGDVDVSGVTGAVSAHINDDNGQVSGHSITGDVLIEGRTGDVDFADVSGGVTMQGDFFGTTHLERVNGAVRFHSSRTQFEVARLDGTFEVDRNDLTGSEMLGPVTMTTRYKNVSLERVQGSLTLTNQNGSITVTDASPMAPILINNEHGSVDVGLPGGAGFQLNASTHNGSIENDFGLTQEGTNQKVVSGKVGIGGPSVTISTTEGDVTVRRAAVEPLPPVAPVPPKLTTVPPAVPTPPGTRVGRAPRAPKPPVAPKGSVAAPVAPPAVP